MMRQQLFIVGMTENARVLTYLNKGWGSELILMFFFMYLLYDDSNNYCE